MENTNLATAGEKENCGEKKTVIEFENLVWNRRNGTVNQGRNRRKLQKECFFRRLWFRCRCVPDVTQSQEKFTDIWDPARVLDAAVWCLPRGKIVSLFQQNEVEHHHVRSYNYLIRCCGCLCVVSTFLFKWWQNWSSSAWQCKQELRIRTSSWRNYFTPRTRSG